MVEGHQVARTAAAHRATLAGRRFRAESPNGRFADGAGSIDRRRLLDVQSVGKQLFYFFESAEKEEKERQVVAVHFGMSGRARVATLASEPERTPTTRLRLVELREEEDGKVGGGTAEKAGDGEGGGGALGPLTDPPTDPLTLHVACMTLLHSPDESLWRSKRASLGPDPLREDADPEAVFAAMLSPRNAKKSLGLLLMSQEVVAGVGNIYRAEICHLSRVRKRQRRQERGMEWESAEAEREGSKSFDTGKSLKNSLPRFNLKKNIQIHPETPAGLLSRRDLENVWANCVRTLRDGFESGSIVTVRDGPREAPADPSARRFVYNRENCATCGDRVVSFDINARTAYACPSCQPLRRGVAEQLPEARRREAESATPARLFNSRCAPDEISVLVPAKMTVAQLRAAAEACGLETKGKKAELVSRLEEHHAATKKAEAAAAATPAAAKTKREPLDDAEDALAANLSSSSVPIAVPGTAGLVPATPAAAAAEKRRAGEKGNVEHVAQAGDDLATARGPALKRGRKAAASSPSAAIASEPVTPAPKQQKKKMSK